MVTEEKEYVFIGGRMQGKTRDLIDQLISENKKLKNDYNNLAHDATKWDKLREWVKDYKDTLENDVDTLHGVDLFEEHALMILDEILAIMNSLDLGEKL